ncbi:MAG: 50S ribosomal protein L15, partial [Spirochaetales bacterium]|nr:50S ribosomal protein L15 [Spirochaetales bacterium]
GQTPLIRRLPKRGFKNSIFQKYFNIINIYLLDNLEDNTVVTKEMLVEMGLVKYPKEKIKILGNGDFSKKLEIHADAFSFSAKEKIEKAGGKAILK